MPTRRVGARPRKYISCLLIAGHCLKEREQEVAALNGRPTRDLAWAYIARGGGLRAAGAKGWWSGRQLPFTTPCCWRSSPPSHPVGSACLQLFTQYLRQLRMPLLLSEPPLKLVVSSIVALAE